MLPVLPGIAANPNLASDWDSLAYTSVNQSIAGQVQGMHISQDGVNLVTVDINSIVRSYVMSVPGDITSIDRDWETLV